LVVVDFVVNSNFLSIYIGIRDQKTKEPVIDLTNDQLSLSTKLSLKRKLPSSTNKKLSKKSNKEEVPENEKTPSNEILQLELEERRMALREREIKARAAEAEARKLEAEAEALEIANSLQMSKMGQPLM